MALSFEESMKKLTETATTQTLTASSANNDDVVVVDLAADDEESTSDEGIAILAASSYDDGFTYITSMYKKYNEYYDPKYSTVDFDTKNVTVDSTQVNLTQETNSQFIPFEIERYYDGIDLTAMLIQIHYVNSGGSEEYSTAVNVCYNDDYIHFAWLVDSTATYLAGELTFEIMATGVNEKGESYIWKSRPNGKLNIIESLAGNGLVEPDSDWYSGFVSLMTGYVAEAAESATAAQEAAATVTSGLDDINSAVEDAKNEIAGSVSETVAAEMENYYTKEQITTLLNDLDTLSDFTTAFDASSNTLYFYNNGAIVSSVVIDIDGLSGFGASWDSSTNTLTFLNGTTTLTSVTLDVTPSAAWQTAYTTTVQNMIDESLSNASLDSYDTAISEIKEDLTSIHEAIDDLPSTLQSDYYTKTDVDGLISTVNSSISAVETTANENANTISDLTEDLSALQTQVDSIGDFTEREYDITYEDDQLTLYENDEVKTVVTITGGSGGSTESSTITITRITADTSYVLYGNTATIQYTFSSIDNAGDTTGAGTATWRVNGTTVATSTAAQGNNSFDITDYLSVGSNTVRLQITDTLGSVGTKTWTITVVQFYLTSTFDDTQFYTGDVTFRYTPYGDLSKQVVFVLDGATIAGITTSVTGRQLTQTIPAQSHGAHLLEVYMTAEIDGQAVTSESIYKDIIWVDESETTPIIGCATTEITMTQYNTTNITYTVYDPSTATASVTLSVDGEVVSTLNVDRTAQTWAYRPTDYGTKTLTITCGSVSKSITVIVEELGIDVEPVTTGLALDFNPSGYSNNDTNRLWTDGTYSLSVSSDFDWSNGGYQIDDDGDTYFCVRAGTTASFDYKLFADDAKQTGKEFKFVFRTANVRDYDGSVASCYSNGIGIKINAQSAFMYSEQNSLTTSYKEDEYIELEFMILPDSSYTEMLIWTDGIPLEVINYSSTDNFTQSSAVPITIGSADCDVWVYRMKAYTMDLTDDEMLDNFIADAKNANEMIDRYTRNQIVNASGEIDPDILAENCPDLRVIKISAPTFTTGKKNEISGTTVQHIYKGGREVEDNWTATGTHKGQGTSSEQYGESARNIDINMSGGFTFGDGSTGSKYAMTSGSMPEKYFNIKLNVASSENANNACLADDFNTFNPYVRDAKAADSRVRDTMEFHPCVIFIQETDTTNATVFTDGQWHFYGCGDFGNSKKNDDTMGMDPDNHKEVIIEVDNNTDDQTRFLSDDLTNEGWDGDNSFEFRYISDDCTDEEIQANKDAWQALLTWVVNATPTTFVNEFEDHFVKDSLLYHYLFTERFTMVDNRAKNTFYHTSDGIHFDICFDYDNDTALGNNNTGGLTLTYGYEDTDTIGDGYVFNAYDSKIWCYIRDYMFDDLAAMYLQLEQQLAWTATRTLDKFETYQQVKPERLWIADMRRKYLRPYEDNGTTFYLDMCHGDKKHQRRQFEYYQEKYMASKYVGSTCTSDAITLRGYTPTSWTGVAPSGDLNITPYADTYIVVKYGSYTVKQRAKRGNTYLVECPIATMNDTEVYPYNASILSSIGDVSAFYPRIADFSAAVKHTSIIVGNGTSGYSNTNMTSFGVGNNVILEHLNLQNVPNLAQSIDLSGCANLIDFYADGSGITGVIFATGGKIEIAHLPASITSITMKNLNFLTDLQIESYDNITTLIIEDSSSVDELTLVQSCPNLTRVRLTEVDWSLDDETLLDELLDMAGINESGYNTTTSVLTGSVYVPVMREKKLAEYQAAWPDLEITYSTLIDQYTVTFVNDDEAGTVLDVQYVDKGSVPEDPLTREDDPIATPTKESTVSTDYTFAGWDQTLVAVFANTTITAVYNETTRQYTVRYLNKGTVIQTSTVDYGSSAFYTGDTPTYTAEEAAYNYYLFSGWDKSPYVTGNKDINAVYDSCVYTSTYFDNKEIGDLSPVEIYTMIQLGVESSYVSSKDAISIELGHDYSYSDIEENEVISSETIFSGSNYIDTGLSIMDEDRSWVLAIDFTMDSSNSTGAVLAQCYQNNGSNGFKLSYNSSPTLAWGTSSMNPAAAGNREIMILRHVEGETGLHVYTSNLDETSIGYTELSRSTSTVISNTLVFGANKADDGMFENYCSGTVYWAKVWYIDLGDDACRELAAWPHETLPLEMAGFKKYYLSDGSNKRCSMTFLASRLLSRYMVLNNSTSNVGGYPETSLNTFLNERFVEAFPVQWRQLLKQVTVSSSAGGQSEEIVTTDCYAFVPARVEVDSSATTSPYAYEGTAIDFFSTDSSRVCYMPDGTQYQYILRSPSASSSTYWYRVTATGSLSSYQYASTAGGVRVMICI